jgi:tetratricopeptide (TPR) repeat protein
LFNYLIGEREEGSNILEEALNIFKKIKNVKDKYYYYHVGIALAKFEFQKENYLKSKEYLDFFKIHFPDDEYILNDLANISEVLKQYQEAELYHLNLIEKYPNPIYYSHFGNFYMNIIKNFDKAEEYFKLALNFDPLDEYFLLNLGKLYLYHKNNYKLAEEYFKKILKKNEKNIEALSHYAGTLLKTGDYQNAKINLLEAYKIYPKHILTLANLGKCEYLLGLKFKLKIRKYASIRNSFFNFIFFFKRK